MSLFSRWMKFNLVGALGMAVQLVALALLNHLLPGRYLYATAAAIELTLLHNFVWHTRYTWRDRRNEATVSQRLLQFHLSNGLISLLGNLGLMHLLVSAAHWPVVRANVIAIAACSIANFILADRWAFSLPMRDRATGKENSMSTRPSSLALMLLLAANTPSHAQTTESSSQPASASPQAAPLSANPQLVLPAYPSATYIYHAGVLCGLGASTSTAGTKPTGGCGAGITFVPLPLFVEVGVMGPQANRSYVSGYVSVDGSIPLAKPSSTYLPMAIVGYSRLFETGHALDYGLALALPRFGKEKDDSWKSLRIELRDYWTFANPTQHNVMLRVGWMIAATD